MHAFNERELKYYDLFHKDKDYEAEAKALPLTGRTVLEIGSGTGLMTKELRKLGYRVTTVDPNHEADYPDLMDVEGVFDNVLLLYDVLNYIPNKGDYNFRSKLLELCPNNNQIIIEIWDKSKGVKPFTYKKVGHCHRVRLGFRWFNTAHLLFIYWGKGLALAYHKLYL